MVSKLAIVTITGADERTPIADLVRLTERYPFVEWGILFGSQSGVPRFPAAPWITELAACANGGMQLSLHLCGAWRTELLAGGTTLYEQFPRFVLPQFQRMQLNINKSKPYAVGTQERLRMGVRQLQSAARWYPQVIFQLNGVNDALHECLSGCGSTAGLFDRSGGRGIAAETWPEGYGRLCGWAGGLGPQNLEAELPRIAEQVRHPEFWVDMEGQVRTGDVLDLHRVARCLEIAEQFRKGST